MKEFIHNICRHSENDYIIYTKTFPNWIERRLGFKSKMKAYRGSYTVWHEYPSGKRLGYDTLNWLIQTWCQQEWIRKDTRH